MSMVTGNSTNPLSYQDIVDTEKRLRNQVSSAMYVPEDTDKQIMQADILMLRSICDDNKTTIDELIQSNYANGSTIAILTSDLAELKQELYKYNAIPDPYNF